MSGNVDKKTIKRAMRTLKDYIKEHATKISSLRSVVKVLTGIDEELKKNMVRYYNANKSSSNARYCHLAYMFLKGTPYAAVEQKVKPGNEVDEAVLTLVLQEILEQPIPVDVVAKWTAKLQKQVVQGMLYGLEAENVARSIVDPRASKPQSEE